MKTKILIAGTVTAVLAAVLFFQVSENGSVRSPEQEAATSLPAAGPDPVRDAVPSESFEREAETTAGTEGDPDHHRPAEATREELNELVSRKMRADSAVEFEGVIQDAESMGMEVANDWRMQLEVLCHPSQVQIFEETAEQSGFAARGMEFCADHIPEPGFSDGRLADFLTGNIPTRRQRELDRLLERDLSDDAEAIDDDIKRALRTARFEEEILAVSDYLAQIFAQGQVVLWQPVPVSPALSNERVVDLQALAIELYACRRFLNCGPRSPKMIMNCTFVPICEAWWTYEDFVAASLAPFELAYVHSVIASIGA